MAVKKKVVDIDTGKALKSVKSLRTELKELQDLLVGLEKGTQEYNQVLQLAADIKHDLTEMNQELAASAMDFGLIMGNTTKTIGGAVAGFLALSASMSLLGIENKDTLELIKKLQALMALTQGIAGVENGIKSFNRLITAITNSTAVTKLFSKATNESAAAEQASSAATKGLQGAMIGETAATKTATVATHAFKKALISTGIGAIVVAVGMLIANLDKLGKVLGLSSNEAEKQKKAMTELEAKYSDFNSTIQQYNYLIKGSESVHKDELNAMDARIEKMKAEGASDAAILAEEEKNLARRKEIANELLSLIQLERSSIKSEYAEMTKEINGFSENLSKANVYDLLASYSKILESEKNYLKELEESEASDKLINKSQKRIKQYEQLLNLANQYIGTVDKESNVRDNVVKKEESIHNQRVSNLKKLKEEYAKFNQQLEVDGLKSKEKELKQLDNTEAERLKTLKKYRQEGVITKAEYEKKSTEITELYSKQRLEIEFKYAEQESKKREELLKKQFDLEKAEASRRILENQTNIKKEHQENIDALNKREISIIDYYNREKEIVAKNYEMLHKMLEDDFKKQTALISEQINERYELLKQNGISEEQKSKLLSEIAQMSDLLLTLEAQHSSALLNLAIETNNTIADLNQSVIEEQMESLRILTENIVSTMDTITGIGDGLSSQWATAFDTMSNGLINLGQKIKEGGAQWQDYAQLAVAAFSAAGSVMSALADQLETETKEGFEQLKKYQIAAVTMNMLGGVISAWTSAMNPANAWMTIWGQIAMGAASTAMILATGIMQIQKIKQQQFGGSGGASASPSGGAMGSVVAPVQYTQDVQGAEIEGAIKDSRVYVVESDITNTQDKVAVAENEAKY